MAIATLHELLDSHNVRYVRIIHSPAYTAQETAAAAHVSGWQVAKTVMVKVDGQMAMAVLPAPCQLSLPLLQQATGADTVELASEEEFKRLFPTCEVGAMPPFGNLYGMDVYVDHTLAADEEITFNAGTHTELIRLRYEDFRNLAHPLEDKLAA